MTRVSAQVRWAGPYWRVPSFAVPPDTRLWIKNEVRGRSYDTQLKSWLIPLDAVTLRDLHQHGIAPVTTPPPIPPAPEFSDPRHLFTATPDGIDFKQYQIDGIRMMIDGQRLLADEQGLGKTYQLIYFALNSTARRVVVLVPAGAVKHPWESSLRLALEAAADDPDCPSQTNGNLIVLSNTTDLAQYDAGVVIATPSLLTRKHAVMHRLIQWRPEILIADETHAFRNIEASTTKQIVALASRVPVVVAATGTIMMRDDYIETLPLLMMTGEIEHFGGLDNFLDKFTWVDQWNRRHGRQQKRDQFKQIFDQRVIRRTKAQSLPDLPKKTRRLIEVDVDLTPVNRAHADIEQRIVDFLLDFHAEHGVLPSDDELYEWVKERVITFSTLLRVSAGIAKTDYLVNSISKWVDLYGVDRPLIVWFQHQEVLSAVADGLADYGDVIDTITGQHTKTARGKKVEAFQRGDTAVLLATIPAAGTAITLTRSHDVVIAEPDWSPALMVQAEDRCHRIGQEHPVKVRIIVGKGTLDEHVVGVLRRKQVFLERVLDGDHGQVDDGKRIARQHMRDLLWHTALNVRNQVNASLRRGRLRVVS